jgi:HEAT repeat protein
MPLFPDTIVWLLSTTASLWGLILLIRAARAQRRRFAATLCAFLAIIGGVVGMVYAIQQAPDDLWRIRPAVLHPIQVAALGLLPSAVSLAIWSYRGDRSRGRRRCPKCWYDMTGLALKCPECGHDAKREQQLFRPCRYRRRFALALLILAASYATWVGPSVKRDGPIAAIPSWVLIAGLPYFPDSYIGAGAAPYLTSGIKRARTWPRPSSLQSRVQDGDLTRPEAWVLHFRARRIVLASPRLDLLNRTIPFLSPQSKADPAVHHASNLSVVRAIASSDPSRRHAATLYLGIALGGDIAVFTPAEIRPLFPGLLAASRTLESDTAAYATAYATQIGPESDELAPEIIERLSASPTETGILRSALRTAARLSSHATRLVIDASRGPNFFVRRGCAYALGSAEAGDRGGTDRLFEMLDDPEHGVQYLAAVSLVDAAVRPSDVIPRVLNWAQSWSLADSSPIDGLSRFKLKDLAPFAPQLVALLGHPSSDVRKAAASRLRELIRNPEVDVSAAAKPLEQMIQDPLSVGSRAASELLAELHRAGR